MSDDVTRHLKRLRSDVARVPLLPAPDVRRRGEQRSRRQAAAATLAGVAALAAIGYGTLDLTASRADVQPVQSPTARPTDTSAPTPTTPTAPAALPETVLLEIDEVIPAEAPRPKTTDTTDYPAQDEGAATAWACQASTLTELRAASTRRRDYEWGYGGEADVRFTGVEIVGQFADPAAATAAVEALADELDRCEVARKLSELAAIQTRSGSARTWVYYTPVKAGDAGLWDYVGVARAGDRVAVVVYSYVGMDANGNQVAGQLRTALVRLADDAPEPPR